MFPQGSAELFCTCASAFAYVNIPSCPTVFCEALAPMHAAGVCAPLLFGLFMHLRQCMRGASIGKPVQSAVLCCPHVRGSLVFVVAPFYFEHSFWVVPPYPLLFLLYIHVYYISVMGALLPFCVGAHGWPAMGAVSSRSWLPIVEAPGCRGTQPRFSAVVKCI